MLTFFDWAYKNGDAAGRGARLRAAAGQREGPGRASPGRPSSGRTASRSIPDADELVLRRRRRPRPASVRGLRAARDHVRSGHVDRLTRRRRRPTPARVRFRADLRGVCASPRPPRCWWRWAASSSPWPSAAGRRSPSSGSASSPLDLEPGPDQRSTAPPGPIVGTLITVGAGAAHGPAGRRRRGLLPGRVLPAVLRRPIGTAVELLAGIPSIVYGMWGLFVFAPFFAATRRDCR